VLPELPSRLTDPAFGGDHYVGFAFLDNKQMMNYQQQRNKCGGSPPTSNRNKEIDQECTSIEKMKLKFTITGPQVQNVGYRPYLMELAMRLALKGFEVYNDEENEEQAVTAIAEGDEQRVARLYNLAMKGHPQLAKVDNIKSEEYTGDVMPFWQFANINSATQMNKAIPILLEMRDDLNEMKGDLKAVKQNTDAIPQVLEEVKGMWDELQPGFAIQFKQMQKDIESIKERLGMP
jgi:acylphosphatase